jgi:hypothetical protein
MAVAHAWLAVTVGNATFLACRKELYLDSNKLMGTIPSELSNIATLT